MNGPSDDETPGTGVATGPSDRVEAAVRARSIDLNTPDASPQTSNVIPFRRPPTLPSDRVEVVEVIHWFGLGFNEFWIATAGPWKGPPDFVRGGRDPWERMAVFPHTEPAEASFYAHRLAQALGVPIVDLAGIVGDVPPGVA